MSNPITDFFLRIGHWFGSPQGREFAHNVESFAISAIPIVIQISDLVPSRTFENISGAYQRLGVPLLMTAEQLSNPTMQGVALRELAASLLKRDHPLADGNTLNAAVELALGEARTKQDI